jgi:hypothetical protein
LAAPTYTLTILANGRTLRQTFSRLCEYAFNDPIGIILHAPGGPVVPDGGEAASGGFLSVDHQLSRIVFRDEESILHDWQPGPGESITAVDTGETVAPFTGATVTNSSTQTAGGKRSRLLRPFSS